MFRYVAFGQICHKFSEENYIVFLISVEQRLEKDEKWWNKFAGWDDQQALVSCLPGRGVGGRWSRSICTEYNTHTVQSNAIQCTDLQCNAQLAVCECHGNVLVPL